MGAFSDEWWDERMIGREGVIDLNNAHFGSEVGAWVRWRLIDDLMSRFYVDYGIEGVFSLAGSHLYQMQLASPSCARAPRYFGRVCANGPHVAYAGDIMSDGLPPLAVYDKQMRGHGDLRSHSQCWKDFAKYRSAVIHDLGLAEAGVVGHERCFHRRGRSAAQLAFRIAVLLWTDNGRHVPDDGQIMTVTPGAEALVTDLAPWFRQSIPPGAPRSLLVTCRSAQRGVDTWIVTNEGVVHGDDGLKVNVRDEWRGGAAEDQIAAEILAGQGRD